MGYKEQHGQFPSVKKEKLVVSFQTPSLSFSEGISLNLVLKKFFSFRTFQFLVFDNP